MRLLVRAVVYARLVGDPIYFPGFAAVVGEGLLEVRRGVHVSPLEADQDGFTVDGVLGEKFATAVFEFADLGWVQDANLAIGPIEPPLVRLRIVRTQSQTFDVAGGAVD